MRFRIREGFGPHATQHGNVYQSGDEFEAGYDFRETFNITKDGVNKFELIDVEELRSHVVSIEK